ncbi:MAG: BamA/TamA family outer membrane protein, partial [Deltaproteobacteria bacterium]|nr:BamA/TamA family outer membrane protein [Deltaproteobacteria bacterium]
LNRPEKEFPKYVTSPLATTISISDTSGAGWGRVLGLQIPDLLLVSEIKYTDNNFFSRAKSLLLPLKYGFSTTSWHRLASFAPTYMDSRFFYPGLTLRLTPFIIYDRATTTLDLFKFGGEISISKELLSHLFGTLSYEISEVKTKKPSEDEYSPFRLENKVMPFLLYDRLDHPINPTKGIFVSSLLSYINAIEEGVSKNFIKYELTAKLFFSVKKKLIFGTYFHYGNSKSFEAGRLPDEERFTLGGNKGMRGFSDDGVSQYYPDGSIRISYNEDDGKWGMPYGGDTVFNGSFEVRFPIIRKIGLWGSSFIDYGALAERLSEICPKSVRMSFGFGLRWLLGDQIPFRLDYGIILDKRCKEMSSDSDPENVKCLLNEEVGNIHFGILYTF